MTDFYFMDANYPEEIYLGDERDWDWIIENGGYPMRYNGPVADVGEYITTKNGLRFQIVRASRSGWPSPDWKPTW